ncbi:MAG: PIG-L family deacetylase, partial [Ktedonobacterales bacterium]
MPLPSKATDIRRLDKITRAFQGPLYRFPRRTFLIGAGATALLAGAGLAIGRLRVLAANGSTLSVVAHPDDDLLFQNPDIIYALRAGRSVRLVYITAGDDGRNSAYWEGRESGVKAAYAELCGTPNSWNQADAGISGHPISVYTPADFSTVSLVFLRLPDGNVDGSGFPSDSYESSQKLWQGTIPTMRAVDGSTSYSQQDLINTLADLLSLFQPDQILTQDYAGTFGDGDHSDHHAVAYMTQAAVQQYTSSFTLTGYLGYATSQHPANVTGSVLAVKQNAFYTYGQHDGGTCSSAASCAMTGYASWLLRQYTVSASPSPDLALKATATASSQNTSTRQTANKAIDGVIDGYPHDYTREWATVGGKAGSWLKLTWASPQTVNMIVLYDRPNLNDQITAGNIQFSDGSSIVIGPLNNDGS